MTKHSILPELEHDILDTHMSKLRAKPNRTKKPPATALSGVGRGLRGRDDEAM
jgi:hypothetical protein